MGKKLIIIGYVGYIDYHGRVLSVVEFYPDLGSKGEADLLKESYTVITRKGAFYGFLIISRL